MKSLNSDYIVKLYDLKQTKKNYYLMLEYCSGGDLDKLLGKRQNELLVQKIVHQVAQGLYVLFAKNIMHRDLKLGNLLFSNKKPDAIIKLADFGLARKLNENEFAQTFCGTPLYMAPEILAG